MIAAVIFFGREPKEAEAGGATENATVGSNEQTAPATTNAGAAQPVKVTERDFKIVLRQKTFRPGSYDLVLRNDGPSPHNLVVKGPNLPRSSTATIPKGATAKLNVALQHGTYELYCSVPGHKQLGMDLKIKVS